MLESENPTLCFFPYETSTPPSPGNFRQPVRCSFYALSQNFEKQLLALSCLSVRMDTTRPSVDGFSQNLILEHFFDNLLRKFKFYQNLTRITGTLHEDQNTFLIISRRILLRVRNVSDKSCRENQNKHLMFNFFPKILTFIR